MRKLFKICTFLCGAMAVLALIMGIKVLIGRSGGLFIGIRLFSIVAGGGFTGFIGNLLGMVIAVGGYGLMALYGITAMEDTAARKNAFIYGVGMTAICAVSAIFAIVNHSFTMGDLMSALLPIVYTGLIIKSA